MANTGILSSGSKCLALFEAGQPYNLDPTTLKTRGVDLLDGHINAGAPFSTGFRLLDKLAGMTSLLAASEKLEHGFRRIIAFSFDTV